MNRFKCPACGRYQCTSKDEAEGCIYCGKRTMMYKVKFTHSGKSRAHIGRAKVREGKEIYRHPEGRYIVLEFEGKSGKFREAFWPEEVVKVEGLKWQGKDL